MKIIKDNLKESMTPNERHFFALGKSDSNKATSIIDSQAIFSLKKMFQDMTASYIQETDEFRELVTNYEKAYVKGLSESLHNPLEIYID